MTRDDGEFTRAKQLRTITAKQQDWNPTIPIRRLDLDWFEKRRWLSSSNPASISTDSVQPRVMQQQQAKPCCACGDVGAIAVLLDEIILPNGGRPIEGRAMASPRDACVIRAGNVGNGMIGRDYLLRQATTLLRMARAVHDPAVSGSLAAKAADLKTRLDDGLVEPGPPRGPPKVRLAMEKKRTDDALVVGTLSAATLIVCLSLLLG